MLTHHDITTRFVHVTAQLGEYDPWCDPEFDDGLEALEREFAELRLQLASE